MGDDVVGHQTGGVTDEIFTLDEIAELFKFKARRLREIIKKYGIPVLQDGHEIRFDQPALVALKEAIRKPCHLESSAAETPARSRSTAASTGSAISVERRVRQLLSREKKPPRGKPKSSEPLGTGNVVGFIPSAKRQSNIWRRNPGPTSQRRCSNGS